ncbi:hypothetical protein JCM8208_005263 [Rhodotorula glutinis]
MPQSHRGARNESRASRACQQCKRAKNRCLPSSRLNVNDACQRCERKGLDCDWESGPDRRRNRPDTLAQVTALQDRVKDLEARLAQAQGRPAPADDSPSFLKNSPHDDVLAMRVSALDLDGGPVAPHGELRPDANGALRWHTETALYKDDAVDRTDAARPGRAAFLPVPLSNELHAELIYLAFKWHLNVVRFVEQDDMTFDGKRSHAYSPFVHLVVLAVGARYMHEPPPEICADPADPSTRGFPFYRAALELLTSEIAAPDFSTIRGLLILANLLGGIGQPRAGWLYSGVAHGLCIDFGLHLDPPHDDPISPETREIRRKLFWAAFVHHVNYAICFGRPSAMSLKQVHQPLPPLPDSPSALISPGAPWPFEIRIQRIGLKVCWLNYTGEGVGLEDEVKHDRVRKLWRELQAWHDELPPALRDKPDAVASPDVLHLISIYVTLVVLLLKPYFAKPSSSADISTTAAEECSAATLRLAGLVGRYEREGPSMRYSSKMAHLGVMYAGVMALQLAQNALRPSPSPSCGSVERSDPSSAFPPSALPLPPRPAPAPAASASTYLAAADTLLGGLVSHAQTWPATYACVTALCRLRDSVLAPPVAAAADLVVAPELAPSSSSSAWPEPLVDPPPLAHEPASSSSASAFSASTVDLAHLAMQGMPGLVTHAGEQPLWNTVAAMGEDELAGFWNVWAAAGIDGTGLMPMA